MHPSLPRLRLPSLAVLVVASSFALARGGIVASPLVDPPFAAGGSVIRAASDLDGDGRRELIVADPAHCIAHVLAGADGTELFAFAPPEPPEPGEGEEASPAPVSFGNCVVVLAHPDALGPVGVLVADSGAAVPCVRRFTIDAAGATLVATIEGTPGGAFGRAMAYLGDVDLDGQLDYAIADPDADGGAGRVDVYSGATATPIHAFTGDPGEHLGAALSNADWDLTGDAFPDFVVGAPAPGSGTPGRALVCSLAALEVAYAVAGESPDEEFGSSVVNLGAPPSATPGYVARFAVAAPHRGAGGAVDVFHASTREQSFAGPHAGAEFGRHLGNAGNTKSGASNEVAVADVDTEYVCSAATGLVYYVTPLPDAVLDLTSIGPWNPEDNYADTAVLYETAGAAHVALLSGKTQFYETTTLTSAVTVDEAGTHASITANVGPTHFGRPFLLLAGSLLDGAYSGANQGVGGPGLYLPIDFSSAVSLYFLGLPPAAVSIDGTITYAFDIDTELALQSAAWCAANSMVFVGVLQTGTTMAVTNPVSMAATLGG